VAADRTAQAQLVGWVAKGFRKIELAYGPGTEQ
jgi:hypothetical protein